MRADPWWFQARAIAQVGKGWDQGARAVCLVSPTGSGKTVMAEQIAKAAKAPVCVVHTLGLKRNGLKRLCETVTLQSVIARGGFDRRHDLIIWDECHHSAGATWGTVLDYAPKKARILGLTATPQRSDGKALDRFDEMVVAAHYSELLMAGTIVPYRCLYPREFRADAEPDPAVAYKRFGEKRKAIIYCKSVEQANQVAIDLGKSAAPWHGQIPWNKRSGTLEAFEKNELRVLATVDALTEGVDVPDSDCIVLASKCHNVGTYLQKTGRGGRRSPGKDEALLLDLSGAHLRHGPPTEDREYSISGTGIQRKGRSGGSGWDYDPIAREPESLDTYDADLVLGYNWRAPTEGDKRRQLGWMIELAGRRGWSREIAESVFETLFQEPAPVAAE